MIKRFQEIAAALLMKHYGLTLNDTNLWDESVVAECIKQGYRPYQVVAEHAELADINRIDKREYGVPSKSPITEAEENAVIRHSPIPSIQLNDRYGDTIIGDRQAEYDGLEIQGVRNSIQPGDQHNSCCEPDNENPQFFSVYVHMKEGGVECVGDFATHASAIAYAKELSTKYSWPIRDYVSSQHK